MFFRDFLRTFFSPKKKKMKNFLINFLGGYTVGDYQNQFALGRIFEINLIKHLARSYCLKNKLIEPKYFLKYLEYKEKEINNLFLPYYDKGK